MLTLQNRTLLANRNGLTHSTRSIALVAELNMVASVLRTRKVFVHQDMHDARIGIDQVQAPGYPVLDLWLIPSPSCGSIGWPIGQPLPRRQVRAQLAPTPAKRPGQPPKQAKTLGSAVRRPTAPGEARSGLVPLARPRSGS